MTNTYLLEIIKALSPEDRREIAAILAASYHQKGANAVEVLKLYEIILGAAPNFSEEVLAKEKVYFQVFSDPKMVQGKLEKLMAELNKHLRTILLTKRYLSESNEDQQQIDWAAWLREHGLAERSQQSLSKLKKQKSQEQTESLSQYKVLYLIAEEEHELESINNQVKGVLNIPDLMYHLGQYYYNFQVELENRYLLQQKAAQLPDLEMDNIGVKFFEQTSLLLRISKNVQGLLKKELPTPQDFQVLMEEIKSHAEVLPFQTMAQFLTYLRNTCTMLINAGQLEFIPILHDIQKDNLQRGMFDISGKITPNVYINLVHTALMAKEIQWAKTFVYDYKDMIIGGDKDHFFYKYSLAHCFFEEGNYDAALDNLPDAPSASHYHRRVRRLELKIYYEMGSELLMYKIPAFRKFIERTAPKTIAANLREMDLNFINLLYQLSLSPAKDKARSAKLVERIQKKKLLSDRAWLLEKARALG